MDHTGLLLGQREAERCDHLLGGRDQLLGVAPLTSHADHKVIGVADESIGRPAAAADRVSLMPLLAHRLPRPGVMLIQRRECDVSHQRRENPALRSARDRSLEGALLGQDPGLEERLDQRQDALVHDAPSHPVQNGRVRELIEARRDVGLQNPLIGAGAEVAHLGDRVPRSASRPKPVGAGLEVNLEDRLEHQLESGLNDTVAHRRDPQITQLTATLGDRPLLDRIRPETPGPQLLTEPGQELLDAQHLLDVVGGLAVHAR